MNDSDKDPKFFLLNIVESIQFIEDYTKSLTFDDFKNSQQTQDAVFMRLAVIGEAAKDMPNEIKSKNRKLQWSSMAGLRNVIVHNYFGVKLERIWRTIKEDLPATKKQAKELLSTL